MTTPRHHRLAGSFGWDTSRGKPLPPDLVGRFLRALGADRSFVDDVMGDLAEEHARRTEKQGAVLARWWYVAQATRALPHLALNAAWHGGTRGRIRLAAVVAGVAVVPALLVAAILARDGAPARLVIQTQNGASPDGGLIVNTRHPVRLATGVFDAKGRPLDMEQVRYRVIAGSPLAVSTAGIVTCSEDGDAVVRASAGNAATSVTVRCRPVRVVRSYKWVQLVAGDSAYQLDFEALAPGGERVHLLAGERFVTDTTVARLEGSSIRPLAPGGAVLVTRVGEGQMLTRVSVFQPVRSLDGLRPDQRFVIAPVHIGPHTSITWPLPTGLFWLKYHRAFSDDPLPSLSVSGDALECLPDFGAGVTRVHCLARAPGATLRIASVSGASFAGKVSLEREGVLP